MRSPQNETNFQAKSHLSQDERENLQPDVSQFNSRLAHPAMLQPSSSHPHAILQLQRQRGNRYVNQMLQQSQSSHPVPIQAKMTLGAVGDKYEQEADQVAKKSNDNQTASQLAANVGGKPLPEPVKQRFEKSLGKDLNHVRVHENSKADSINADAYHQGSDIHFAPGKYNPNTTEGLRLIGHELIHDVQCEKGMVEVPQDESLPINSNPILEQQADELGAKAARGERVNVTGAVVSLPTQHTRNGGSLGNRPVQLKALHGWTRKDIEKAAGKKTGRSEEYKKLVRLLDFYHKFELTSEQEVKALENIALAAKEWQQKNQGETSEKVKARQWVIAQLITNVQQALDTTYPKLTPQDFDDSNITDFQNEAVGGQVNKLDYLKYDFGIRQTGNDGRKLPGGEFEGYFKEDVAQDKFPGTHRGNRTGIPRTNPNFVGRNLGMYELDKLLGANLIAPTFRATHNKQGYVKQGYVMKKIQGVTGKDAEARELNNPLVKQSLSNLYLLDFIAGQVDRHSGNYIVEKDKLGNVRGVKGIDNDLAFGEYYSHKKFEKAQESLLTNLKEYPGQYYSRLFVGGKTPYELDHIDISFAKKILALDANDVRNALNGLVKDEEIDGTIARLDELKNFLQNLMNNQDSKLVTEWKY